MKVLGAKIKEARQKKKVTQKELAQGICNQATISNMERKNHCGNLEIFSLICARLEISVEEAMQTTKEYQSYEFLEEIENLCEKQEHKKAYLLMKRHTHIANTQSNSYLFDKYNYYAGLTQMLGAELDPKADILFHFYNGAEIKNQMNIYNVLSLNAIGSYFALKKDYSKAETYHMKSIELINKFDSDIPSVGFKVFYNSAHFYSLLKQHQLSIDLCEKGIRLNQELGTRHFLEQLYYELAYNKHSLGQEAASDYLTAFLFAKFAKNNVCMNYVCNDMKKYNLSIDWNQLKGIAQY